MKHLIVTDLVVGAAFVSIDVVTRSPAARRFVVVILRSEQSADISRAWESLNP